MRSHVSGAQLAINFAMIIEDEAVLPTESPTPELEAAFAGRKCKFGDWRRKKAEMAEQLSEYYGVEPRRLDYFLQGCDDFK